ncbi:MAG TPA: hypothetical protein VGE22_11050 [Solimonas sp.]
MSKSKKVPLLTPEMAADLQVSSCQECDALVEFSVPEGNALQAIAARRAVVVPAADAGEVTDEAILRLAERYLLHTGPKEARSETTVAFARALLSQSQGQKGEVSDLPTDSERLEGLEEQTRELYAWLRQRGLYDPHDYPYGEGPDVCELLTLHETELVRQIPEDKRSQLQRTMDAIAAESASPSPDPEREKLAADIKAAVAELANGEQYPDLLAAIDQLAAMQQPSAAEGKDRE